MSNEKETIDTMHLKNETIERGDRMKRTNLLAAMAVVALIAIFATQASAYYHPTLGRWVSRDPGAGAGSPARAGTAAPAVGGGFAKRDPVGNQYADGINLYQYVRSDPATWTDPSGLMTGEGKYCKCGSGAGNTPWKTVDVVVVQMHGSAHGSPRDLMLAGYVYAQCCIFVDNSRAVYRSKPNTEKAIGRDLVLDEYIRVGTPTNEEKAMTAGALRKGVVYAYYVKALSQGSTGESFWSAAWQSPPAPAIVVSDKDRKQTFPHELGHVLLDTGAHHTDRNNLMVSFNQKYELSEGQCDRIRNSPLVK